MLLPLSLLAQQKNVKFTSGNFKGNSSGLKFALDKIKQGDDYIKTEEYSLALPFYLSADSVNPYNADLNTKIGLCYIHSYYKARSLKYFRLAYSLDKNVSKRMPYFLGEGYQLNYKFDSAVAEYQIFLRSANAKEKKEIDQYIAQCNNGKDLVQHPVKALQTNLGDGINSPFPDYSPFITADEKEMVFTSKRVNTTGGYIDPGTGEYFEDIYISYFKDGKWQPAENIGAPINSGDNDATAYLTPDGQKLFIFRDVNGGDIYMSTRTAEGWSTPVALNKNINSSYHESSVCLSPDGKVLYFVSDRPGGKGGRDIYKAYLQPDSSWGPAINMGDTINTSFDEEGVYIHPDGKSMYFSSKGHNSMGGYDVYKSILDSNGKWGIPQNMGYPINTPDDDVFFIVSASGKHGYFASAKDTGGFGGLDIYRVEMQSLAPKLLVIKGVVGDSISRAPLMASIKLTNKKTSMMSPSNSNATTGDYVLSLPSGSTYEIDVHADGYPDYSFTLNIPDTTSYREITKNIYLLKPGAVAVTQKDTVKPVAVNTGCVPDKATILSRFAGLSKDTNTLLNIVNHIDSGVCLKDMKFTVQIGAYHFPKNFRYKNLEVKPVAVNGFPDGITRFTMGSFESYLDAQGLRDEVWKKGGKDAFVTGVYNGKRVILEKMIGK